MAIKRRLNGSAKRALLQLDHEGLGAPWLVLVGALSFFMVIWIGIIIDAKDITDVSVNLP